MVLSANISAVGDAAGAVLITVENPLVPIDRRVWATNPTLNQQAVEADPARRGLGRQKRPGSRALQAGQARSALGLVGRSLASAAALLPEALACVGTYDAVSRGSAEAATDVRPRAATARNPTSFNLPVPDVAQALSAVPPIL
jgi:hypothetical protein